MNKIELSEQEIQVIDAQLSGKITHFTATDEERTLLMGVIDKAEALCEELDAYDELDGDLIRWFWGKYQAQEATAQ